MGYLVLPITGLPFALVGLLPVQVQAGGWFWAEAAGAFAHGSTSLGLELCLLVPRQRLWYCANLTRFVEDAQGKDYFTESRLANCSRLIKLEECNYSKDNPNNRTN